MNPLIVHPIILAVLHIYLDKKPDPGNFLEDCPQDCSRIREPKRALAVRVKYNDQNAYKVSDATKIPQQFVDFTSTPSPNIHRSNPRWRLHHNPSLPNFCCYPGISKLKAPGPGTYFRKTHRHVHPTLCLSRRHSQTGSSKNMMRWYDIR